MDDKFSLELTQEEGILLLTSARLLDKLVAGVTIHARERDELIREIIEKMECAVSPALSNMSEELAQAIVDSVLGCDEAEELDYMDTDEDADLLEVANEAAALNYPMYCVDETLPKLEKALIQHMAVRAMYYSFARESVDSVTLNPFTIVKEDGLWRLVAYCHERDEVLMFRVDRIKELSETAQHFETPKDFLKHRHATFSAYG